MLVWASIQVSRRDCAQPTQRLYADGIARDLLHTPTTGLLPDKRASLVWLGFDRTTPTGATTTVGPHAPGPLFRGHERSLRCRMC